MSRKIVVQCIKSGKFVKEQFHKFVENNENPVWILVDDITEATIDPGYVCQKDLTIQMIQSLQQNYGCGDGFKFKILDLESKPSQSDFDNESHEVVVTDSDNTNKIVIMDGFFMKETTPVNEILNWSDKLDRKITKTERTIEKYQPQFIPHYKQPRPAKKKSLYR